MTLYIRETGEQHPSVLLFIHGGGVSGWMWEEHVAYFHNYHCIVPDLPGHGMSEAKECFSIKKCAEELIDYLKTNVPNKEIIVVGFSIGAQIALEMLAKEPTMIDYAMINSATVKPMPLIKKMVKPTALLSYPLIKNKKFSKLQARSLFIPEDKYEQYYKESLNISKTILLSMLEENMSYELPECFKSNQSKLLVTAGNKERTVMKDSVFELMSRHNNCKALILPSIGHGLPLAEPLLFCKLLEDFLEEAKSESTNFVGSL